MNSNFKIKLISTLCISIFLLNALRAQEDSIFFTTNTEYIVRFRNKSDTVSFNYLQCRYKNKEIEKKINSLFIISRVNPNILSHNIDKVCDNIKELSIDYLLDKEKDSIRMETIYDEILKKCSFQILFNKHELVSIINTYNEPYYSYIYDEIYNINFTTGEHIYIDQILNLKKIQKVSKLIGRSLKEDIRKNKLDTNDPIIKHFIARCKKGFDQWDIYFFYFKTNKDGEDGINFYFTNYSNSDIKSKYKHKMDIFIPFKKLKPYMTDRFRKRVFEK